VIAFNACSGPIPLRWAYLALRGIAPALAEEALGRMGLSRCALGFLVIASKARCGPIPLRWAYGGSAGSVLRSQRKLWGVGAFALCARGFWCSLPRLAADRSRSAGSMGGSAGGRKDLDGVGAGECGMFLAFLLEEGSG